MVKKYSPLSAEFANLPVPVREVLVHSFDKLDKMQFQTLREIGPLDHPNGNILDYDLLADSQETEENKEYPTQTDKLLESYES